MYYDLCPCDGTIIMDKVLLELVKQKKLTYHKALTDEKYRKYVYWYEVYPLSTDENSQSDCARESRFNNLKSKFARRKLSRLYQTIEFRRRTRKPCDQNKSSKRTS